MAHPTVDLPKTHHPAGLIQFDAWNGESTDEWRTMHVGQFCSPWRTYCVPTYVGDAMGAFYKIGCNRCGVSGEVLDGMGRIGIRSSPSVCRSCGMPGSTSGQKRTCAACRSKDVEPLAMGYDEELGPCRRPGCGGELEVQAIGSFD